MFPDSLIIIVFGDQMQIFSLPIYRMDAMDGLGDRIKIIRQELKLNQKEFARRIGVAATTMNNYEREEREPPIKILIAISKLSRRSLDWLLLGEDNESLIMKQLRLREKELEEIRKLNDELLDNADKIKQVADRQEKYKSKSSQGG